MSDRAERSFVFLRDSWGGERPSQGLTKPIETYQHYPNASQLARRQTTSPNAHPLMRPWVMPHTGWNRPNSVTALAHAVGGAVFHSGNARPMRRLALFARRLSCQSPLPLACAYHRVRIDDNDSLDPNSVLQPSFDDVTQRRSLPCPRHGRR